jgi:CubicO group peptidase (beta-lactamase class C family)
VPVKYEPGTRQLRSDIDYLLLGEICEIITGMPLEKAFSRFVAGPLKLRSLNFVDLSLVRSKNFVPMVELFAPTGECPRRQRMMCGQVWDETAWVMGGVAGHNGLFGTARDLLIWAHEFLSGLKGESSLFASEAARAFLFPNIKGFEPAWRLGFEVLPSEGEGAEREVFVASSATGCSVVIDPWRDMVAVVLTSGAVTGSGSRRLVATRSEIHAALVGAE